MKKIPENVMLVVKALLPLFVIVILYIIFGNLIFSKMVQINNQITQARTDQTVLIQKLDLLRNVAVTGERDSNSTTLALPSENPLLAALSQLKNSAAGLGLILNAVDAKVSTSSTADQNISSVSIGFKVIGDVHAIETFLTGIRILAPIITINSVKVVDNGGIYTGEIAVNSYWAGLPTELPTNVEDFQDLTQDERSILEVVNNLTKPSYVSLPPSSAAGKSDPFSP